MSTGDQRDGSPQVREERRGSVWKAGTWPGLGQQSEEAESRKGSLLLGSW